MTKNKKVILSCSIPPSLDDKLLNMRNLLNCDTKGELLELAIECYMREYLEAEKEGKTLAVDSKSYKKEKKRMKSFTCDYELSKRFDEFLKTHNFKSRNSCILIAVYNFLMEINRCLAYIRRIAFAYEEDYRSLVVEKNNVKKLFGKNSLEKLLKNDIIKYKSKNGKCYYIIEEKYYKNAIKEWLCNSEGTSF